MKQFLHIPEKFSLAIILCLFTLSINACKENTLQDAPIPIDTMTMVLSDLHIAEGYSLGLGDNVKNKFDKNYDSLTDFYSSVLKHYHLSYNKFDEAMEWYKRHPAFVDTLYANIQSRLEELNTIYKIAEPGTKTNDKILPDTTNHTQVTKPQADTTNKAAQNLKPFTTGEEQ